jgi:hypothetical protein
MIWQFFYVDFLGQEPVGAGRKTPANRREYHIRIVPAVLGKGRPLFEATGPLSFELYDSRRYDSGLMLLQYRQRT